MEDRQPTNKELLDTMLSSFTAVEEKMTTKEDLGKLKHELLDSMDNKISDLKGDLTILMRKEYHKVTELIKILRQKEVLDEVETEQLLKLQPFPQA